MTNLIQGRTFLRRLKAALDTEPSTDNAMFYEAITALDGLLDFIAFDGGEAAEDLKKHVENPTIEE